MILEPICKFCGAARDVRGIHDLSCTAGGDIVLRHNAIRDAVYRFAQRAKTNPELEKAGLLAEPGVLLELRRPADVLIEGVMRVGPAAASVSPIERTALDIKVINALGVDHRAKTVEDPISPMDAYHEKALKLEDTAARCAAQGITYVPMVFTIQGGVGRHAEAILHQLANRIAPLEQKTASNIFGEITADISRRLATHAARSILRRSGKRVTEMHHTQYGSPWRALLEAADVDEDESEGSGQAAGCC